MNPEVLLYIRWITGGLAIGGFTLAAIIGSARGRQQNEKADLDAGVLLVGQVSVIVACLAFGLWMASLFI